MEEKTIEFGMYLTGHDRETIEQMFDDWEKRNMYKNILDHFVGFNKKA